MDSASVRIHGERPLEGSVSQREASSCVVACPPHPNFGGSRRDMRLRAVGKALADETISCLRFDYGPWDDGVGEQQDVKRAVQWASDRYESVGIFGYSFGASLGLLVAPEVECSGVAVLAPAATTEELVVTDAVNQLPGFLPFLLIVGSRDTTVDWEPVVEAAREKDAEIMELPADHFFIGNETEIGRSVASFFAKHIV